MVAVYQPRPLDTVCGVSSCHIQPSTRAGRWNQTAWSRLGPVMVRSVSNGISAEEMSDV